MYWVTDIKYQRNSKHVPDWCQRAGLEKPKTPAFQILLYRNTEVGEFQIYSTSYLMNQTLYFNWFEMSRWLIHQPDMVTDELKSSVMQDMSMNCFSGKILVCLVILFSNSNLNSTFIVLNLFQREDSKVQWTKHNSIFMSRYIARVIHHGRQWNIEWDYGGYALL